MNPAALGIGVVIFFVFVYCDCRTEWKRFRRCLPAQKFNYHITDIWTAIIALTPSLAIAAYAIQHESGPEAMLFCVMLVVGQIAGAFCGRLRFLESGNADSARASASMILTCALLGGFFVPIYLICFAFVFPAVVVYLVLYFVGPALSPEKRA